jgi:hypothetical protein
MFDIKNKDYREDLRSIIEKLSSGENFAFSKFADGELHILINRPINNGEFWFTPTEHQQYRRALVDSFKYKDSSYYVGISCPCCIGGAPVHKWMKEQSTQIDEHLTWANIFVNANYKYYLNNMVPLYNDKTVILVSNSDSNLEQLPFPIEKHFTITKNAWITNYNLIEEIQDYIQENKIQDALFLFCAGPFGNILTHQLHNFNKNNTYIDIGSTLNTFLLGDSGKNRGYLRDEPSITKMCIWGEGGS